MKKARKVEKGKHPVRERGAAGCRTERGEQPDLGRGAAASRKQPERERGAAGNMIAAALDTLARTLASGIIGWIISMIRRLLL
jgi:hypothetical protein